MECHIRYKTVIKEMAHTRHQSWVALFFILCSLFFSPAGAQVGKWRTYMSYYEPQQIVKASNSLFVRASNGMYQYNLTDHSITTFDKTTGLNDTYITHIAWNQQAKRLIIIYQNSNIDLIDLSGNVTNISALYRKTMTEDKTIDSLTISSQYAYLYARFGIVKVDMQRAEISDTYTKNHPEYPTNLPISTVNANWDAYIETVRSLKPGGPKHNHFGFMKFMNNRLYTCNGDYDHAGAIQILADGEWTIYQDEGISAKTGVSYTGSYCIDVDPTDAGHIFAGSRNGLYEYRDGLFTNFYNNDNSPIEPYNGVDKEYTLVTGTMFDQEGSLWILNSSAPTKALIKYAGGQFTPYPHAELMKLNTGAFKNRSNAALSKMMTDSEGLTWFVNNNWVLPALYCYNTANDNIKAYETFVNQDGTTFTIGDGVRCIAEDKEKNLWIGTSKGLLMLERTEINNGGTNFTQVKVPRNDGTNYADYLLADIDITAAAIDGGNRKWFGTSGNGVYLISADNMTQVQHFTTENSTLLSNDIKAIAINDKTGEVFFGTANGLCSYVSDATQTSSEMTKDNVYAYPNPVTPDYTGLITIVGLSYQADVKIVSSSGKLIAQGKSNGGTFTWDGCDQSGNRVASGIYMATVATSSGDKGTVCKIAVIR